MAYRAPKPGVERLCEEEWRAYRFVTAVKREKNGASDRILVRGAWYDVNNNTFDNCIQLAGWMLADELVNWPAPSGTLHICPFPSSDAVHGTEFDRFPSRDLAKNVVDELAWLGREASVTDILRFREKQPSARKGGTRDANKVYANLMVTRKALVPRPVVLLDDVLTSGSRLRAADVALRKANFRPVAAITLARTWDTPCDHPIGRREEVLDDFRPR